MIQKTSTTTRAQIVKRVPGQEVPILIKFRINPHYAAQISSVLEIQNRTVNQEERLKKKKEMLARMMTNDAYKHGRKDAAGNMQPDTGIPVFANGKKGNSLCLAEVWGDLLFMGYNVVDVYSYQKDNDNMIFLVFEFNVNKENPFPQIVEDVFVKLLEKSYKHVHIWDNPDGTITINSAHIESVTYPNLRISSRSTDIELSIS